MSKQNTKNFKSPCARIKKNPSRYDPFPEPQNPTPLYLAIKAGDDSAGAAWLKRHRVTNLEERFNWRVFPSIENGPYLLAAGLRNHPKTFAALLRAGAKPNVVDDEKISLLIRLIAHQHPELVRQLVEAGCRINVKDNEHNTPLDWCYRTRQFDLLPLFDETIDVEVVKDKFSRSRRDVLSADETSAQQQRLERLQAIKFRTTERNVRKDSARRRAEMPDDDPRLRGPNLKMSDFLAAFPLVTVDDGWRLEYFHDHLHSRTPSPNESPNIFVHPASMKNPRQRLVEICKGKGPAYPGHRSNSTALAREAIFVIPMPSFGRFGPLPHVSFARQPEGFIQFALFIDEIHQFFLCWHALYGHQSHILDPQQRLEYLKHFLRTGGCAFFPLKRVARQRLTKSPRRLRLMRAELQPRFRLYGDLLGVVESLVYRAYDEKVGFYRRRVYIRWPNVIEKIELRPLFAVKRTFRF